MRWSMPLLVLLLACSSSDEEPEAAETQRSERPERQVEESAEGSSDEGEAASPGEGDSEGEPEREVRTFEPAEDGAEPIEPAIGQWVRYGVSWREGGRSTTEYRIVDRQNDSWWLEVTDRRGRAQNHVRMRVRPKGEGVELLALTFHRQGQAREEVPERLLPTYEPMLAQWLEMLFPGPMAGQPEDVTVPAGTFPQARRVDETVEFGGRSIDAAIWRHPAVPVTGMVRFRDQAGGHTVDLLGFGLQGARSAF